MKFKSNRAIRAGDALSQFFNVLLFNGHPNESMSGRAWRTKAKFLGIYLYKVIDTILWFDKDHCKTAYENDIAYAKTIVEENSKSPVT